MRLRSRLEPPSSKPPTGGRRACCGVLLITASLLLPACGAPEVPRRLADAATRSRSLQETASRRDQASLIELFRIATEDPNHFLRAKALEAIYVRRPPGRLPPGAVSVLERLATEDPDLTRRHAVRVLLHFRGRRALDTAAEVWATSENPRTQRAIARAVAEAIPEAELARAIEDPEPNLRSLVNEAAAVAAKRARDRLRAYQKRRRSGRLSPRVKSAFGGTRPAPRP